MGQKRNQLSKSSLVRSIQCSKSLYLYKNHYDLRDPVSVSQQQVFDRGIRVGKLAQQLFPGGKDVSPPNPYSYDASIAATKALVLQQFPVIYEAAFKHHGLLAALDILVCRDNKWYAYEVKSSLRISETYLLDCAIQYHIITSTGLALEDFRVIHVNGDYVKTGDIEIAKLFTETSVLPEILEKQEYIREKIGHAVEVLLGDEIPHKPIGIHCTRPYPCDFRGYCWKGLPGNSVWYLPGLPMHEKAALVERGLTTIDELRTSDIVQERNRIVVEAYKKDEAFIQPARLHDFMQGLNYPLYFFDLEAFQPAIPVFDGTKPFERIPFQYSLHYAAGENAAVKHSEYLGSIGVDPREDFVLQFLADTVLPGSILVFNTLMEKSILNNLAEDFPAHRDALMERIGRIVDFEIPFRNVWYYHPAMLGSFSLKAIAAALLKEADPFAQTFVKDGETAMAMYNELYYERDFVIKGQVLKQLSDYCRADTLALFNIYKKIKRLLHTNTKT